MSYKFGAKSKWSGRDALRLEGVFFRVKLQNAVRDTQYAVRNYA